MAMSCADYCLTLSTFQMVDLIRAGVPADRIRVARNGVDLDLSGSYPNLNSLFLHSATWGHSRFGRA